VTTEITADALQALMRSATPHAVLDLRERGTYEHGHVFRSTSLPRRQLETRLPTLVTARATPLVLVDEDGSLAVLARPTLTAMGYRSVRVLQGGLRGWRDSRRALVQGLNVPSKVFGERMLHEMKTPEVSPQELEARIRARADMVIVDSRTPEEYHRGCIPGAVSVPGGELVLRIPELVSRPETTIVVHCGGRTRSYIGAESVRSMRLPNPVVALNNGTMGWTLAGLELERGAERWAPPVTARGRAAASVVAKRVAEEEQIPFISPEELRARWDRRETDNVYVVDVRMADEYVEGHVAGAIWAPGGQAVQATDDYFAVRAASYVFVDDGFARAVMTAAWMRRLGVPDVAVLAGGLAAWRQAGGAVATGRDEPVPFGYEAARAAVPTVEPGDLDPGDATVLSVGGSDVHAAGHVPGAAWVCRSRLEPVVERRIQDRDRAVVLTCGDGRESVLAAATLRARGYRNVRALAGGVRAWVQAGRPVEAGPAALWDDPDDVVQKPYERGRAAMEAYLRWEEALDGEGQSPHALLPPRAT
jgi:rhodanese-related sulfurtransferase